MHARHHVYLQWFLWKFFLLLVLLSIHTVSRIYHSIVWFIHFIPIFFPSSSFSSSLPFFSSSSSKLIDRHSYLQGIKFWHLAKFQLFSSIHQLNLSDHFFFLRPFFSSLVLLFFLLAFLSFSFLFSDLLFDTNIIHCFKKTRSDIWRSKHVLILSSKF